jgi:hypothetical protein
VKFKRHGNNPNLQRKIDQALARLETTPPRKPHNPKQKISTALPHNWTEFRHSAINQIKNSETNKTTLSLWLPSLKLTSQNLAERGQKNTAKKAKNQSYIQVRHHAKRSAAEAIMRTNSKFQQVQTPVEITVTQVFSTKANVDPGNLYNKPLIDLFLKRSKEGIPIITDDRYPYVVAVTNRYMHHQHLDGVLITFTHCEKNHISTEELK